MLPPASSACGRERTSSTVAPPQVTSIRSWPGSSTGSVPGPDANELPSATYLGTITS
jgi:hypothetical protein